MSCPFLFEFWHVGWVHFSRIISLRMKMKHQKPWRQPTYLLKRYLNIDWTVHQKIRMPEVDLITNWTVHLIIVFLEVDFLYRLNSSPKDTNAGSWFDHQLNSSLNNSVVGSRSLISIEQFAKRYECWSRFEYWLNSSSKNHERSQPTGSSPKDQRGIAYFNCCSFLLNLNCSWWLISQVLCEL